MSDEVVRIVPLASLFRELSCGVASSRWRSQHDHPCLSERFGRPVASKRYGLICGTMLRLQKAAFRQRLPPVAAAGVCGPPRPEGEAHDSVQPDGPGRHDVIEVAVSGMIGGAKGIVPPAPTPFLPPAPGCAPDGSPARRRHTRRARPPRRGNRGVDRQDAFAAAFFA